MQSFYATKKADKIWCFTEMKALDLYFFEAGRRRTFAPTEDSVVATLEKWLINHARKENRKILKKEQAHAAARRALAEGLKKLKERAAALAEAPPQPANNLAGFGLDDIVIQLLQGAGYGTKLAVERATDLQLKAIPGIDRARLMQIRHFIPRVGERTQRQRAAALAGQLSLF